MEFSSHAKWILSGEHTVTRGGKAIAFPLKKYKCSIEYETFEELDINHKNMDSNYNNTFCELLQRAAEFLNINFNEISGKFLITNNIRMNSGLGSSAAICVNIANIFMYLGFTSDTFSLAKHLEDIFHQKSSGLDIAVAMSDKPIIFQNNKIHDTLDISFWPHLMLSYSGEKSETSKCADIVKSVFCKDHSLAVELDSMMNHASDLCEHGLINANFDQMKDGISLANEVFTKWGLNNESTSAHINMLLQDGAAAAKPAGSGLGGYIVSLWEKKPKKYSDIYLTLQKP